MAALGELVVKLSANIAEFTGAMDKAAYQSEKRMEAIKKAAEQAGVAIGAALVATAGSIAVAMKLAVDRMDQLGESAQKLGITTEALSGLEYVAGMSGVTVESLHGSLNKLNKSIAEGNPAFEAMGIKVRDANGELKSADVILKEMAGKFAGYKDGAGKSALAMEAMGKSGADLVPMLNQGADGFDRLTKEARRLGVVIGDESSESAGRFNDTMDRVAKTQQGIVTQMAAQLLPVLERGATEFELVAKNVDLVSGPTKAVTVLFQTLAVLGSDVAFVFKMTGQEIGGMAAQLAALASGDFKGFSAIREAMVADSAAARADLDAFQQRIMNIGTAAVETAKKAESAGGNGGIAAPIVKAAKESAKAIDELKRAQDALVRDGQRVFEQTRTPVEQLAAEYDRLQKLLDAGAISWDTYGRAVMDAQDKLMPIDVITEKQKRLNDMIAATPTAKLEESRARMLELKEAFESGAITAEQFSEAAGTYLGTLPKAAEESANTIDLVISNAFDGAANAIADFALTGKGNFGDLVNSMVRDLIRLEAQMQMTSAFKAIGGFSGIMGSIGSWFSGLSGSSSPAPIVPGVDFLGSGLKLSGARASGGPVSAGGTYLVGERGPELLRMGSRGGTVIPNEALNGESPISISMPVTIDARGADQSSVQSMQSAMVQMQAWVVKAVPAIVRQAQLRNRVSPTV